MSESESALAYRYAGRPGAPPVSLELKPPTLVVDSGRRVDRVRLSAVERVRLTYVPGTFGRSSYRTKLTLTDGKTVGFSSVNWRSMVEAERQDASYRRFLGAVMAAAASANPKARFVAGSPLPIWIGTAALSVGVIAAMALLVLRALQAEAYGAAALGALVGLGGLFQIAPMIVRNRPGRFDPERPPERLLP